MTPLYRDYLALGEPVSAASAWYAGAPTGDGWMRPLDPSDDVRREQLADLLFEQAPTFKAGEAALRNIARLRAGARAVVTGQQVGLFGGPLLTFLKAATAIARAREATAVTGIEHVPVFWLATEDHDLAEVDQVAFAAKSTVETMRLGLVDRAGGPVGRLSLAGTADQGAALEMALAQVEELLGYRPVCEWLREAYTPEATLGSAFGSLLARTFAAQGLVVMDAAGAGFHRLGAPVLRYAIEHAAELETALLARSAELEAAGYHAQVLVSPGHSLLFLLDVETGARQALRRVVKGSAETYWKAGGVAYATAELLSILERQPERLSPNALLRPVFQDAILPTAAYIGGPAEVAYFAQCEVIYRAVPELAVLGRVTPVLPRFSATLLEPAVAAVLDRFEVQLPDVWTTPDALAQRLGARSMPVELKRRLSAAGNAFENEAAALTEYMTAMDPGLGRSAGVSTSKMLYQMNRLRRMAARFTLEKETGLAKQAALLSAHLYPDGHLQERVVAGVQLMASFDDPVAFAEMLVREAADRCPGHSVVPAVSRVGTSVVDTAGRLSAS